MSNPQFDGVATDDIAMMLIVCGESNDPSDKAFAKECAEEIKRRKPKAQFILIGDPSLDGDSS